MTEQTNLIPPDSPSQPPPNSPAVADKPPSGDSHPPGKRVSPLVAALLGFYIILLSALCIILLIQLLSANPASGSPEITPTPTAEFTPEATSGAGGATASTGASSSGTASNSTSQTYTLLSSAVILNAEMRLLLLVVLSGALGGLVHDMRSYIYFVGNRDLVNSWIAFYVVQPFLGGGLAALFYMVVRAGFFTGNNLSSANDFGFFATGSLVGLFSEQALEKLKEVAATLFAEAPKAKDPTVST